MERKIEELELQTIAEKRLEQEDKSSEMQNSLNRKTKNIYKIARTLLETRYEQSMKKQVSKSRKEERKVEKWNYILQQKKDWNRKIKAVKCGKVEKEGWQIYLKLLEYYR